MENKIQRELNSINKINMSFLQEAYDVGLNLKVGKTAFIQKSKYFSEVEYKNEQRQKGNYTYHCHLCCSSKEDLEIKLIKLEYELQKEGMTLDRFGVGLDSAMALPEEIRNFNKKGDGIFLETQKDWDNLAKCVAIQPHLGDQMIGSPASYSNVKHALQAGITTIGNISQYFGWDYPEFTDVENRTKSTIQAIALMSANVENGTLIHSNLDDGYGKVAGDLGLLIGCALLEKYIVEDLMHARIAHSFGDMFYSPLKRLVFLCALKKINKNMLGSMIFTNKLERNQNKPEYNTAHLVECILCDMVGQKIYKTGHAITVMSNRGLIQNVEMQEIVKAIGYANEIINYIPMIVNMIDTEKIENYAEKVVEKGNKFFADIVKVLSEYIDIKNPYEVMIGIKKVGIGTFVNELGYSNKDDVIISDFNLYHK